MRHLLTILAALLLCAPAFGQTVKALSYNTNGVVVYNNTNTLTFTNTEVRLSPVVLIGTNFASIAAGGNFISMTDANGDTVFLANTNLVTFYDAIAFSSATNRATTRTNLGLGATWLTNTDVTNFRAAVGLGATDDPRFAAIRIGDTNISFESVNEDEGIHWYFNRGTNASEPAITIGYLSNSILSFLPVSFQSNSHAAATRTNLGVPLPALTNTSNVTMMRALSGSTNTNHPFSGTVSVIGTNNTNTLTFSNGILQSVQ